MKTIRNYTVSMSPYYQSSFCFVFSCFSFLTVVDFPAATAAVPHVVCVSTRERKKNVMNNISSNTRSAAQLSVAAAAATVTATDDDNESEIFSFFFKLTIVYFNNEKKQRQCQK